jgi:hypothetical protein
MFREIMAFITVKTNRSKPSGEIQNFGMPQQGVSTVTTGLQVVNWSLSVSTIIF